MRYLRRISRKLLNAHIMQEAFSVKFINTVDAIGHVLCHDITVIIKDVKKGVAFQKGHVVTAEDIPALLNLGKEHLYVWEKLPGMLHEDEAAVRLFALCQGANIKGTDIHEGKIECIADIDGLFWANTRQLDAINEMEELMIATRHSGFAVHKGDKLAGTRVIPLVIAEEKLTEFQIEIISHQIVSDDQTQITAAIQDAIKKGATLVLCTGGMSVDPDDRTPAAIRSSGTEIVTYGAPVLPGAMMLVGYHGDVPVLGLPGCVMYAKRTIFDLVLPWVSAGRRITRKDIAKLGHGGLCLNCETCYFPNCGFGK